MSLNDLPPELTARVLFYLANLETLSTGIDGKPHISQYASTSRSIQYAVEQHLFSRLSIKSDDTPDFEKLVTQTPRRRALLRTISLKPVLPTYNEQAYGRFERQSDQDANNAALTAEMKRFYAAIRDCNKLSTFYVNVPFSYTDGCHDGHAKHNDTRMEYITGKKTDLWDQRVTTFGVHGDGPRYVAPCSALALLSRHPRVKTLSLNLDDNERKNPELRTQLRADFARDLLITPCPFLKCLDLQYRYEDPCDQRFSNADVRGSPNTASGDAFSASLRRFLVAAPNLEMVNLGGPICIDESFFGVPNTLSGEARGLGLRSVQITMSAVRPDGGWYLDEQPDIPRDEPSRQNYVGLSDDDDDDDVPSDSESSAFSDNSFFAQDELQPDDYDAHREALRTGNAYYLTFRVQPNAAFEKVLEAATRFAVSSNIVDLYLVMEIAGCPRTDHRAEAFELEFKSNEFPNKSTKEPSTLYLRAPREWQMSTAMIELWRTKLGTDGIITNERW